VSSSSVDCATLPSLVQPSSKLTTALTRDNTQSKVQ